jgi:hypothetical protein
MAHCKYGSNSENARFEQYQDLESFIVPKQSVPKVTSNERKCPIDMPIVVAKYVESPISTRLLNLNELDGAETAM